MPWEKGQLRGPGRPKGSVSCTKDRLKIMKKHNTANFLIKVARGEKYLDSFVDPETGKVIDIERRPTMSERLTASKILMDKTYPSLKAIEIEKREMHQIRVVDLTDAELLAIAAQGKDGAVVADFKLLEEAQMSEE